MIYFVTGALSNICMQVAAIFVRIAFDIMEGLFAIGLAGSTGVLILSFIEDAKTVLS